MKNTIQQQIANDIQQRLDEDISRMLGVTKTVKWEDRPPFNPNEKPKIEKYMGVIRLGPIA